MNEVPALIAPGGSDLLGQEEGYIVGSRGHALMRVSTDRHMITVAGTGGGKGRSVAITNLLDHPGSVFSVEIGGATYLTTHKFRRDILKQNIYLLDPYGALGEPTASYNPLDMLDENSSTFISDVNSMLASLLTPGEDGQRDEEYWYLTVSDILRALIVYTKTSESVNDSDRNLHHVRSLLGKYGTESWKGLMEEFTYDTGRFKGIYNDQGQYFGIDRNQNTDSIISRARGALSFLADNKISSISSQSSFDIKELRDKKASIYIVMKEMKHYTQCAPWLRLIMQSAFDAAPNAQDGGQSYKQSDRILFMLDEFTQLGKMRTIEDNINSARQKGITIWIMIQSISKQEKVYGQKTSDNFFGQCAVTQVFEVGDETSKEYVSKRAGKRIAYVPQVTHGLSYGESSQKNWSKTESIGAQDTFTEGVALSDTETWQHTDTRGSSHTTGTSSTTGTSFTDGMTFGTNNYSSGGLFPTNRGRGSSTSFQSSFTTNNSQTTSSSTTDNYSRADSQGGSKGKTDSESRSHGTNTQTADQQGESYGENRGTTYQVSYTPQILPSLEPYQVEQVLGTENRQILFIRTGGMVRTIIDQRANHDQIPALRRRAYGPEKPETMPEIEPLRKPLMLNDMRVDTAGVPLPTPKVDFSKPVPDYATVANTYRQQAGRVAMAHVETHTPRQAKSRKDKEKEKERILGIKEKEVAVIVEAAPEIEKADRAFSTKIEEWRKVWRKQKSTIADFAQAVARKEETIAKQIAGAKKLAAAVGQYEEKLEEYRQDLIGDLSHLRQVKEAVEPYHDLLRHYGIWRGTWTGMKQPEKPKVRQLPAVNPRNPQDIEKLVTRPVPVLALSLPTASAHALKSPVIMPLRTETLSAAEKTIKTLKVRPDRKKLQAPRTLEQLEADIQRTPGGKIPTGFIARAHHKILALLGKLEPDKLSDLRQARYSLARQGFARVGDNVAKAGEENARMTTELREDVYAWKTHFENLVHRNRELDSINERVAAAVASLQRHKRNLDELPIAYQEANRSLEYGRININNQAAEWPIWQHLEDQTQRLAATSAETPEGAAVSARHTAQTFDAVNENYRDRFDGPNNNHGPT